MGVFFGIEVQAGPGPAPMTLNINFASHRVTSSVRQTACLSTPKQIMAPTFHPRANHHACQAWCLFGLATRDNYRA